MLMKYIVPPRNIIWPSLCARRRPHSPNGDNKCMCGVFFLPIIIIFSNYVEFIIKSLDSVISVFVEKHVNSSISYLDRNLF